MNRHTSTGFDLELKMLRDRLLAMGGRAEKRIFEALRAFETRDDDAAERVILGDDEIDRDEIEIDELAQTIIATRQPVASDLRFITMSMKLVTDLERIGDLASNIAKRAKELNRLPSLAPAVEFGPLGERVQASLRHALDSFVRRDAEKAASVIDGDVEIDRENASLFTALIGRVADEPATANRIIPLTSVARSLERIGDHAKNIAEEVVYMVRGRDVRHRSVTKDRS
jgi:phosphate transport system protein